MYRLGGIRTNDNILSYINNITTLTVLRRFGNPLFKFLKSILPSEVTNDCDHDTQFEWHNIPQNNTNQLISLIADHKPDVILTFYSY